MQKYNLLEIQEDYALRYRVKSEALLKAGDTEVPTTSGTVLEVKMRVSDEEGPQAEVFTMEQTADTPAIQVKKQMEVALVLSRLTVTLHLLLGRDGAIRKVLNKDELFEKWEGMLAELSAEQKMLEKSLRLLEVMVPAGIEKLEAHLQSSMVYYLLFMPLYGKRKEVYLSRQLLKQAVWQSRFFNEMLLPYRLYEQVLSKTEDQLLIRVSARFDLDYRTYDTLQELYEKKFRTSVFGSFAYQAGIEIDYEIGPSNGSIRSIQAVFRESLSEKVNYNLIYAIDAMAPINF